MDNTTKDTTATVDSADSLANQHDHDDVLLGDVTPDVRTAANVVERDANVSGDADSKTSSHPEHVSCVTDDDDADGSRIFCQTVTLFDRARSTSPGRRGTLDRDMFEESRTIPGDVDAKGNLTGKDGPCFIGGTLEGDRRGNGVESRTLLVLDIDGCSAADRTAFFSRLKATGYERLAYSTVRHLRIDDGERWRVVLMPSRPLDSSEYAIVVRAIIEQLAVPGIDGCSSQASRLMYLPTTVEGEDHYTWGHAPGDAVDVDAILAERIVENTGQAGAQVEWDALGTSSTRHAVLPPDECLALLQAYGGDPDERPAALEGAMRTQHEASQAPPSMLESYHDAFFEWATTTEYPDPRSDSKVQRDLTSVQTPASGCAPKTFADLVVKRNRDRDLARERERSEVKSTIESRLREAPTYTDFVALCRVDIGRDVSIDDVTRESLAKTVKEIAPTVAGGRKIGIADARRMVALDPALRSEMDDGGEGSGTVSWGRRFVDYLETRARDQGDVEITQNQHGEMFIRVGEFGHKTAVPLGSEAFLSYIASWLHDADRTRIYGERERAEIAGAVLTAMSRAGAGDDGGDALTEPVVRDVFTRHGFTREHGSQACRRYTYLGGSEKQVIEHVPGRAPRVVGADEDIGFKFRDGGAELPVPQAVSDDALYVGGARDPVSGAVTAGAELGPAVKRLLWHLVAVPESMRMVVLGRIVLAYMPEIRKQPLTAFIDSEGTTGKSPTVARLRELIDPLGNLSLSGMASSNVMIRSAIGRWARVINEVERLTPERQTELKGNADGDTSPIAVFYKADQTLDIDMAGPTFITSNTPASALFSESTLRDRTLVINPEPLSDERRVEDTVADNAFNDEFETLFSTVCALVARVLEELPRVEYAGGFDKVRVFARVVDALHRVLRQPGSMAQTMGEIRAADDVARFEGDEFLSEIADEVVRQGGTLVCTAAELLDTVDHTASPVQRQRRAQNGRGRDSTSPSWPTDAAQVTERLKQISVAAAGGLVIELPINGRGERLRKKSGRLYQFSLNDSAPSREEVPTRIGDIVPAGRVIPDPGARETDAAARTFAKKMAALVSGDEDMGLELRRQVARLGLDSPADVAETDRDRVEDAVLMAADF